MSRSMWLIILAAACVYLVGNSSVSLWDRDEPRYAQTSRQMLHGGDWVVPRLLDDVRTAKPIFIYWCQAAAMKIFGDDSFGARLPSVIGMLATLLVVGTVLRKFVDPQLAWLTMLILGSSALSIAAAKMCLTDAVLLLFVTTAQICLGALYLKKQFWLTIVMWIAIGFAGLTKGPVVLGVQLTTMLVLLIFDWKTIRWRWWPRTNPIIGVFIAAAICGPWLYLIHVRSPGFLQTIVGHDVVDRMQSGLEGHKGPPGYYLLTIWGTFFPWSLLLPATIIHAWKNRQRPLVRFALAAVIGPWVMFELVQTKLPHYLLPAFVPLAFLTADMLIDAAKSKIFANKIFLRIVLAWGGIVTLIGLTPWLGLAKFGAGPPATLWAMILLPILSMEYARSVYVHFRGNRPIDAAVIMGVGMFILVGIFYGLYLPSADFLRISPRVATTLIKDGATQNGDEIMIDYKEMSLPFYQGGTIRPQRDNQFLQDHPPTDWPQWIVLTGDIWQKTPPEIQRQLEVVTTIHGLNYADSGRIVDVLVLHKK